MDWLVFAEDVDNHLKFVCLEISKRYEVQFVEIGTDRDLVHFLVHSVPMYSATQIARIVKSITAREIFKSGYPLYSSWTTIDCKTK